MFTKRLKTSSPFIKINYFTINKNKAWEFIIFAVLFIAVLFRIVFYRSPIPEGTQVRVTTTVLSDPIKYDNSQYFKIVGTKIYLPLFPEINYGDRIIMEGEVKAGILKNAKLISIFPQGQSLFIVRKKIIEVYQKSLPEPYAGLTAGVVLGDKGALTSDFWEQVRTAGVAHVVVASGTNITFVVSFLLAFTALFNKRKVMMPFVIFGILLYISISGFQPPIIRAGLMSLTLLSGQILGRATNPWRVLIITACAMLLFSPEWAGDIGFILSFASTASLMIFERKVAKFFVRLPSGFREGLTTSIAAQIGVAPILFVTFGEFYILSPLVNALVLWTVPFIMVFGSLAGVIGLVSLPLGKFILVLGYPFVFWFVKITQLFAG